MSAGVDARDATSGTARAAPRRARVAAYGLWQLRDYFMDRGAPTFIVATLFGYVGIFDKLPSRAGVPSGLIARFGSVDAAHAAMMAEFNHAFVSGFIGALVFLGALFAMNGIVANDRKLGYYRFLFAKPMSPPRYYGQAFVLHLAGFLVVFAILALLYGVLVWPVLSAKLMGVAAVMYFAYAAIAFLLSAAARWDWLSLVAVSFAAMFFWTRYEASTHPLSALLYLLPPLHKASDVYAAAVEAPLRAGGVVSPFPWDSLLWFAGYGTACFFAGLIVLRYRRLAIV